MGGQKHTYRHVDILNDHGFDACALHQTEGFRLTWFDNDTRVIDETTFRRLYDPERDYLVLPEVLGLRILNYPGRKVIFDKGLYYGSRALGFSVPAMYPYQSPDVVAVLTVSDHNDRHLRFAYPDLDIHRVYSGIAADRFAYRPLADKKPQVAVVPKALDALATLHHLLHARAVRGLNTGSQFEWILLKNKSEREVADILADSLLFVFLNTEEGLPRTPLEAMLSGCIVVTHDAGPLKEYVPRESRFEPGDLLTMIGFIEEVMASYPHDLERWEPLVRQQRESAMSYSLDRQEQSVVRAWDEIRRKQPPRRAVSVTSTALPPEPHRR
jgi:hypothetical protein